MDSLVEEPFNESYINQILNGKFEMTPVMAPKFTQRYGEMLNSLYEKGIDAFQSEFKHTKGMEAAIVKALGTQKSRLKLMIDLCSLEFFTDEIKTSFKDMILKAANQMQSSLEDSVKHDRTGKLLWLIKNNAINRLEEIKEVSNLIQPIGKRRRQILL